MTVSNSPAAAPDLPPYPAYRPSGVAWLGDVPAHWDVSQAKHQYSIQLGKMLQNYRNQPTDQIVPYLKAAHVQWFAVNTADAPAMWAAPWEIERYGIRKGDLLVCEGGEGGRCAIVGEAPRNCIIQNALHRVRPLRGNSIAYLQYTMRAIAQSGWLEAINSKATIAHFTGEKFGSLRIPVPPPEEQAAIVRYLDDAVARIHRARQVKTRLAELLHEYRQAAIHHAVTRGLNPDAPLKPSGVPWLGKVPAHWEVRRLKTICRLAYGDSLPAARRMPGDIPVYGSNGLVGYHTIPNTDGQCIIIGRKGSFGKVHYSDQSAFAIDTAFFIDQRYTSANIRWLYYLLGWLKLDAFSKDSAIPGLNRNDAYQHIGLLPPPEEQAAIVAHLDQLTAKLDAAIAGARQSAALLDEYGAALIAAAVTGQVDVRAVAGPLTAAG